MIQVSNRWVAVVTLVLSLEFVVGVCPAQSGAETITWDDLLPKQEVPFDDPPTLRDAGFRSLVGVPNPQVEVVEKQLVL